MSTGNFDAVKVKTVHPNSELRHPKTASKGDQGLLWNKLATPQDTHDQESNAPSAPLAK
jgi:hypothetical protein